MLRPGLLGGAWVDFSSSGLLTTPGSVLLAIAVLRAGVELMFLPGAALGLCFGFVPNPGLMIQRCFVSAELAPSQGLSCPSQGHAGEGFGSVWEETWQGQVTPSDQWEIPDHGT